MTTSTTSPETTSSTSDDTQPPTGPDLDAASSLAKVAEIPASNVLAAHAGTMRAAQSTGSSIVLVDLLSGDIISTFTTGGRQVTAAAFNSSGRLLATGSADSSVLIWDLRSEQVIATVTVNTEGVDEMEFSAEASRFAVSSDAPIAGAVSLYDSDDWSVVAEVEPPGENTVDLAFTRDGSRLLIATWFEGFGDLAVLDTAGGELLGQFSDDSDPLASADIAADDRTVAGGFEDGLIRFFDLLTRRETGDELDDHRIEGCEDGFNNCGGLSRVRFSPDGTVLVSGDREGRVFVWDVSAKALVTSLDGHGDRIAEIEFARSGAVLTVVTVDTSRVLVWSGKG